MKTEKSCGAVVFTEENHRIRYVIIQSKEGIYGFPKGHMEPGETEEETALREVREETGLSVNIRPGFRTEDSHRFTRSGEQINKHIVYFLAEYADQSLSMQETELSGIHLLDYETAMSRFQYDSSKRILKEAHSFLQETLQIKRREPMMEAFFKSIIDQDQAPVVVCDMDSRIVYMNPASISRYRRDLTGRSLKDCHPPAANEQIDRVLAWFAKDKGNNRVYTFRNDQEDKDVYMVALRDENGDLIGYYEKHEYRRRETGRLYDIG